MKRFIYVLISTFGILIILYAAFIAVVDPFYVLHMPTGGIQPIQTNYAHYVARGLIRNADYNMLICGSSMCENIHIDDANDIFYGGMGKCLKVVQHGSYSEDLNASLEAAAAADKAEVIILALDSGMFQKPDDEYRLSDIPLYAVESPSILNIWSYLLNKDVLKSAIDLLEQNKQHCVKSQDSWWIMDEEDYSEESLMKSYNSDILDKGYLDFDERQAWNNLKNIESGVEKCLEQNIKIKFFIPPYSILYWDCKDYHHCFTVYKEIWKELLNYPNVEIYAIQFDCNIITNFDNYRNINHYNEAVANEILHDINEENYKLTLSNIDEETDRFIYFLDEYNWEGTK